MSSKTKRTVVVELRGVHTTLELQPIGLDKWLVPEAAENFIAMSESAANEGVTFEVNSAWRSNEEQAVLREKFLAGTGNQAAPVGFSNHEAGRAVDIESEGGTNAAHGWLTANAARFGFRAAVASEPWHWEYDDEVTTPTTYV